MFEFSLVQLARRFGNRLDKELRYQLIHLYRPFRWVPCFMHGWLEERFKRHKKLPVIIKFKNDPKESFNAMFQRLDQMTKLDTKSKIKFAYSSITCCSATLTAKTIERLILHHPQVEKIYYDRNVEAFLNVASPSIHAPMLNNDGLNGEGTTMAVIDTGVYPHQDLTEPTNRIVAFKDFINNRENPYDDNGHGTHCAGDALGNGFASEGKYRGPAPSANVVGVKVLDSRGSGSLSTVIAGVQWCIDQQASYKIDILSLSLGAPAEQPAEDDPLVQIVEEAWNNGLTVVVAAGNNGPDQQTIATPGISPTVITVGAMDDQNTEDRSDDEVAQFSSRGPTIDGIIKPDLLTPGVDIISLRSPGSYLDKTFKSRRVENDYFTLSGTSMSTPICAGVAALILQNNPETTPDEVKQQLLSGCEDRGLPPNVQGEGYLDAKKVFE